ncbi:MAG: hypothetical protein KGZ39_06765 [Simkania sp.]|nr:hypothetical protein [Simkania sp.]
MPNSSNIDCLLKQVEIQEISARNFGFYWEHFDQLIEQIRSECVEVQDAWKKNNRKHLQEEVGDLIQAAVSLAVFCDLDPYETLRKSIEKFQKRYDTVVKLVQDDGHDSLCKQPFEVLMSYWNRAKQSIRATLLEHPSA